MESSLVSLGSSLGLRLPFNRERFGVGRYWGIYGGYIGVIFPIMENQMEKKMKNEMETGLYRDYMVVPVGRSHPDDNITIRRPLASYTCCVRFCEFQTCLGLKFQRRRGIGNAGFYLRAFCGWQILTSAKCCFASIGKVIYQWLIAPTKKTHEPFST